MLKEPPALTSATTNRRCRLAEDAESRIVNTGTGQPFTYGDSRVEKGPPFAFNEAAYIKVRADVRAYVAALSGLRAAP